MYDVLAANHEGPRPVKSHSDKLLSLIGDIATVRNRQEPAAFGIDGKPAMNLSGRSALQIAGALLAIQCAKQFRHHDG